MAEYTATIRWDRAGATFVDNRYSRGHSWQFDGGVEVPASSSPHVVPYPFAVETYRDEAVGVMAGDGAGGFMMSRVTLHPEVRFARDVQADRQEVVAMHHEAHDQCFIARSVRTDVQCEPVLDPESPDP